MEFQNRVVPSERRAEEDSATAPPTTGVQKPLGGRGKVAAAVKQSTGNGGKKRTPSFTPNPTSSAGAQPGSSEETVPPENPGQGLVANPSEVGSVGLGAEDDAGDSGVAAAGDTDALDASTPEPESEGEEDALSITELLEEELGEELAEIEEELEEEEEAAEAQNAAEDEELLAEGYVDGTEPLGGPDDEFEQKIEPLEEDGEEYIGGEDDIDVEDVELPEVEEEGNNGGEDDIDVEDVELPEEEEGTEGDEEVKDIELPPYASNETATEESSSLPPSSTETQQPQTEEGETDTSIPVGTDAPGEPQEIETPWPTPSPTLAPTLAPTLPPVPTKSEWNEPAPVFTVPPGTFEDPCSGLSGRIGCQFHDHAFGTLAFFAFLPLLTICMCRRYCCAKPVDTRGEYRAVAARYGDMTFDDAFADTYSDDEDDVDLEDDTWGKAGKTTLEMSTLGKETNGGLSLEEMNG